MICKKIDFENCGRTHGLTDRRIAMDISPPSEDLKILDIALHISHLPDVFNFPWTTLIESCQPYFDKTNCSCICFLYLDMTSIIVAVLALYNQTFCKSSGIGNFRNISLCILLISSALFTHQRHFERPFFPKYPHGLDGFFLFFHLRS